MHPDKLKNISSLTAIDRYGYFIRKVANFQQVWLIQGNSQYVTLGDHIEEVSIPVWPEKEFAELLLTGDWKDFVAQSIEVHEFIDWLDELHSENIKIAGFPLSDFNAIVVNAEEMKNHLLYELQQYE
jgi:hypothetical protein